MGRILVPPLETRGTKRQKGVFLGASQKPLLQFRPHTVDSLGNMLTTIIHNARYSWTAYFALRIALGLTPGAITFYVFYHFAA